MEDIGKMETRNMTGQEAEDTGIAAREGGGEIEVRPIEVITAEIVAYKQQAGYACIEIGRRLIEAKEQLTHGEWLPWLAEQVEFSEVTAQRFMRLAREYANPSPVTDLGPSKALALLALPASEREEFVAEKHVVDGEEKTVAEMSKRELEKAIRERDEAQKKAATLEEQMDDRLAELRAKLTDERNRAAAAEAEADEEIADLEAQLEAAKKATKSVAVEQVPDKAAIAAAVKAEQEKLAGKIKRAEAAKEKAEKEKAKAEQDLAAVKVAQEEAATIAEQEKKTLAEQVQALQKKLAVASSSDMTVFKLYFDQTKTNIDKMTESITRMAEAGDADGATRLKTALAALLNAALEVTK